MTNLYAVVGASSHIWPGGTLLARAVIAAGAALWLWSLVDALRTSDRTWDAAGQSKLVWVVVIIFLGLLGSILYLAIPRRALTSAVA